MELGKKYIHLPYPVIRRNIMSVEEAIATRRSTRRFKNTAISIDQLSQILWATYGITDAKHGFLTTPSAGATFPLEIYVVVGKKSVKIYEDRHLEAGVYMYDRNSHSLILEVFGDYRDDLYRASLNQEWVRRAPATIVICAVFERTTSYYGERGYRYVYMEVGHAGQNIYLMATALGLGTVAVGAFRDEDVRKIIRATSNTRHPLYIMPIGVPEEERKLVVQDIISYIDRNR